MAIYTAEKVGARTMKAGDIKPPWEIREIPAPPPLSVKTLFQWAGPAVILGALSVGGFEAYHAGFMAGKLFVGIFWLYWISCVCQLFLNQEIARYTIATGETVLQGFTRMGPPRLWAWVSAVFCWLQVAWPAWITGAAAGAAALTGWGTWEVWSVVALAAVFLTFAASRYVYNTLEKIMYAAFIVANLGLAFLTVFMTSSAAVTETTKGWLSVGVIPAGITLGMIGPFLLQPAGGFWNFWHTYWVREKGMGMGQYFGRVTGLVVKPEEIARSGYIFDANNPAEVEKFRGWLRLNNWSLAIFFIILGGVFFTYFASLAGYSARTMYNMEVPSGWKIAIVLAEIFKSAYGQIGFALFGLILIFTLFDSQFSIYDGIARMWADTFYLEHPKTFGGRPYRFWYFVVLGALVIYGLIGLFMKSPYFIWLLANWLGTASQAFITIMVVILNRRFLPEPIRPRRFSLAINLLWASILLVYFFAWTIIDRPF
ncbi:MAG TPA: Nramp family divalent metal transporter [Methylomirabilota bacterium]|nr:Nramp family divalent metal transporter [Methylomirabilota bacterium]